MKILRTAALLYKVMKSVIYDKSKFTTETVRRNREYF